MARQVEPRSEIVYGFQSGDDMWGDDMNANLERLALTGTQPRITSKDTNTPPSSPTYGDIHTVGSSPTGAWAGWAQNSLAVWTYAATAYTLLGWRNIVPKVGWVMDDGTNLLRYNGTTWAAIGGGGGLAAVTSDASLSGDGTATSPLQVANPFTADDETKLDGIATGATRVISIRTDATITGDGISSDLSVANPFTAADESKLDGIAAQATRVTSIRTDATITGNGIASDLSVAVPLPATTGQGGKFAAVNSAGTAVEFVNAPSGGGSTTTVVNTYKGDWAVGGVYAIGDIVRFENNLFLNLNAHTATAANAPYTSTARNSFWKPISYPDFDYLLDSISTSGLANNDELALKDVSDTNGIPLKTLTIANLLGKLSTDSTITGDGLTTAWAVANPFTAAEKTKLAGIADGAQVNPTSIRTDATITGDGISSNLSVANPFTDDDETKLDGIATGATRVTSIRTDATITGNGIASDLSVAVPLPSLSGQGGKYAAVNSGGTAMEFVNAPTGGGGTSIFKGDWSGSSVAYATGDIVEFRHEFYMCDLAHTSTATTTGPTFGATWRTRWHALSGVDIEELGASLTPTQIADDDKVAIADVSTTANDTKFATVANFTTKVQTGYRKSVCITRTDYDALAVKDPNTDYLIQGAAPTGSGSGNYKGDWATATAYIVGDVTKYLSDFYIAILAHTSASTSQPLLGTAWRTNWRVMTQADIGAITNSMTTPADTDQLVVRDVSASGDQARRVTVANLKTTLGVITATEKTKLAGIATGAEVNVQANYTQTSSSADDFIRNKPTLGPQAPATTGNANKYLGVNSTATALEYKDAPSSSDTRINGRCLTQAQYTALATKDADTVYFIVTTGTGTPVRGRCLTQAQYTALAVKDATTVYFIAG